MPCLGVVDAHVAGDLHDAGLGRAVHVVAREGGHALDRGDVDDRPAAPGEHPADSHGGAVHRPVQQHTQAAVDVLGIGLVRSRAPVDPGVVDPGAQRPSRLGGVGGALVRRPVADVARDRTRLAPQAGESALERLGVPVDADDVIAVGRQSPGDGEPDPHRGARNDRARRSSHASSCRGRADPSVAARPPRAPGAVCSATLAAMLLYDNPVSSNALKVRFLLAELGLAYDCREVPIRSRGPTGTSPQNPLGGIPTLDDDGLVMAESNAILRYLAQREGRDDLYPAGSGRARARGRVPRPLRARAARAVLPGRAPRARLRPGHRLQRGPARPGRRARQGGGDRPQVRVVRAARGRQRHRAGRVHDRRLRAPPRCSSARATRAWTSRPTRSCCACARRSRPATASPPRAPFSS